MCWGPRSQIYTLSFSRRRQLSPIESRAHERERESVFYCKHPLPEMALAYIRTFVVVVVEREGGGEER